MKREKIFDILWSLKYGSPEHRTISTAFYVVFSGRKYFVTFEKVDEILMNFEVKDEGEAPDEKN